MSFNVFVWVCLAVIVLIFLAVYIQVKKHIVIPILKDKDSTLSTNLSAFRESNAYDEIVKSAKKTGEVSISYLFEEMCIFNPEHYENDTHIIKVLKDYKDLLHGKIEDPEGKHTPSEFISGIRNSDYGIYLKSQIRVLNKKGVDVSWFKGELKKFNQNDKEELFEADFYAMLEKMGAPFEILGAIVNEDRMEKYSPEDWKNIVNKLKEYDKVYSDADLVFFLEFVSNKETLLNENKMEAFCKLRELGFDDKLAAAYIEEDISSEDLEEVSDLMTRYSMSCNEALEHYLSKKVASLKSLSLQDKYRKQVFS